MLFIGVETLRAGMRLARPILHPDRGDLMLLAGGCVLDSRTIEHLRSHAVTHAWVEFPGLEDVDEQVSEELARAHVGLFRSINRSIDRVDRRLHVGEHVQGYKRSVHVMLNQILDDPERRAMVSSLRSCGPRTAGHLANTCYLSLLVGAHLSGYLRSQRRTLSADAADGAAQLGLGALLHDVGKLTLAEELRTLSVLDAKAESPAYRAHARAGYVAVRKHVSPVAANVVLNHHQRWDGSGFPATGRSRVRSGFEESRPLGGERIHVFARVVSAVDAFDHLLNPPGRPIPTVVALHRLASDRFAGWFDPVVVAALHKLVPAFNVGQPVRLSDGGHAVITRTAATDPWRPAVRRLSGAVGEVGTRATAERVDLADTNDLWIVEADGVDLRGALGEDGPWIASARHPARAAA